MHAAGPAARPAILVAAIAAVCLMSTAAAFVVAPAGAYVALSDGSRRDIAQLVSNHWAAQDGPPDAAAAQSNGAWCCIPIWNGRGADELWTAVVGLEVGGAAGPAPGALGAAQNATPAASISISTDPTCGTSTCAFPVATVAYVNMCPAAAGCGPAAAGNTTGAGNSTSGGGPAPGGAGGSGNASVEASGGPETTQSLPILEEALEGGAPPPPATGGNASDPEVEAADGAPDGAEPPVANATAPEANESLLGAPSPSPSPRPQPPAPSPSPAPGGPPVFRVDSQQGAAQRLPVVVLPPGSVASGGAPGRPRLVAATAAGLPCAVLALVLLM